MFLSFSLAFPEDYEGALDEMGKIQDFFHPLAMDLMRGGWGGGGS